MDNERALQYLERIALALEEIATKPKTRDTAKAREAAITKKRDKRNNSDAKVLDCVNKERLTVPTVIAFKTGLSPSQVFARKLRNAPKPPNL